MSAGEGYDPKKPDSTLKLNAFVYLLASMAVLGGFLFGYDTGIVSGAMLYVPDNSGMRPFSNIWKELIVSITAGLAGIGSLLAGPFSDKFGRKKVILGSSLIFTIGAVVCAAAPEKNTLLVGRILLGLAIGLASMIVPVYLSEVSPAHVRGRLVTGFNFMIIFGQVFANAIGGGFSYIDPYNVGWRLMFGFAAIPAVIQLIGFMFLPESPRWLYKHDDRKQAKEILKQIYSNDHKWVEYEIAEISAVQEQEDLLKDLNGNRWVIWRVLDTPHVRKALFIGCTLQAFQQMAGINTIMYYTGMIIQSAGIRDKHLTIWLSVGIASCQLIGNIIPMVYIDRVGRRVLFIVSAIGVVISLLCMGGSFYMINRNSASVRSPSYDNFSEPLISTGQEHLYKQCQMHSNCDYCITDEKCGFCSEHPRSKGFCLPVNISNPDFQSTVGYCSSPTTDFTWTKTFCETKYTIMPIIFMVIYLLSFAIGFSPIPWVANSEFYPIWARSTCVAMSTFNNWFFNLIVSLTFLSLSEAVTKYGAFFLYAGITIIALIFAIFTLPETRGCSIDEVEMMFMSKTEQRKAEKTIFKRKSIENSATQESELTLSDLEQAFALIESRGQGLSVEDPKFAPIRMQLNESELLRTLKSDNFASTLATRRRMFAALDEYSVKIFKNHRKEFLLYGFGQLTDVGCQTQVEEGVIVQI